MAWPSVKSFTKPAEIQEDLVQQNLLAARGAVVMGLGAVQVSDGGGEIPISHCEIYGQTSLEIDFLKNSADNKNIFKCNLFW